MDTQKSKQREYSPGCIANYFIANCKKPTNLKLNKLSYISYGLALALYDIEIFQEAIQAWKLGPVIPSIYHEFKSYGTSTITIDKLSYSYSYLDDEKVYFKIDNDDKKVEGVLKKVIENYDDMPISALIARTHEEGTPWYESYVEGVSNKIIHKECIKKYYAKLLK